MIGRSPSVQSSRLAEFGGRGMSFNICRGTDGNHFAVTHRTAFTVRCSYLLPDVFLNARRDTMMRRGFTVLIVGSVNSPFRGMTKLRATHLGHLRHRFFQWRRHVHLCRELMKLSDEELRDIGLSRTEAKIADSKVFWLP